MHLEKCDNYSLFYFKMNPICTVHLRGSHFKVDLAINEQSIVVRAMQQGQRHYLVLFLISIQRQ